MTLEDPPAAGSRLDAVGVGPQRTATTWLHACLEEHPELCLPERVKETFFLDLRFDRGWDWYWSHFGDCPAGTRRVEIAPTLFHATEATERLRVHNPTCRIVVSLRDPAERSLSLWRHHRRKGRVGDDFREAAEEHPEILEASRYARHLPRWADAFGPGRLHVLLTDDVAERPRAVLGELYEFLAIEPPAEPPEALHREVYSASLPRFPLLARAAAGAARWLRSHGLHRPLEAVRTSGLRAKILGGGGKPEIDPALRARLGEEFRDDVRFVEEFLGRELPAWRRP